MSVNSFREDEEQKEVLKLDTLMRLYRYLLKYGKKIVLVLLIMCVTIAINLINPLIIERAVNVHIANRDMKGLMLLCLFGVGLNVVNVAGIKLRMYMLARISNQVLLDIRQAVYEHIQKLSFHIFDTRPTGKILARVIGDVNSLKNILSDSVTTLIPDFITLEAARFIIPIFPTINVANILISVTGKFRWEMCKRSQGVYWNNMSDPSLTAEYCDYIQFYKKNRELSEAVKAKIKSNLTSCRNNYREVFVRDYEVWMIYEALGSFRLNKVVRRILATYCPFAKEFRDRLKDNPMVKDLFSNDSKVFSAKAKHLDIVLTSIQRKGHEVPKELEDYRNFLQM